jgi:hypothetical protein
MARITGAPHINRFNDNVKEVTRLGVIQRSIAKSGPDWQQRRDVEVLHKSAIVLLCACWEAYVEDLATAALAEFLDRVDDPTKVPEGVQHRICAALSGDNKAPRKPWQLAGRGWRELLTENCKQAVASFHSPKHSPVDDFFAQTIGLKKISDSWKWSAVSAARARVRVDRLLELRGAIAHRVDAGAIVDRKRVKSEIHFVHRLAVCSHNRVHQHLRILTGGNVWPSYRYGAAGRSEFPSWWGKGYPWQAPNPPTPSEVQA